MTDLEAQLRDANWNLQKLQTQYDYVVSKTSTHNESTKHTEGQLDVSCCIGKKF